MQIHKSCIWCVLMLKDIQIIDWLSEMLVLETINYKMIKKQNWLHKVEEDIILVTRLVQVESLLNVHCIVCVLNQHQLQTTAPHKPFCCSRKSSFPLNRCMMLRHKHMHHGFPNLNPHLFVCLTVFCRFKHQWLFINVSFENSKIHSQNVIVLSKQY